MGQDSFVDWLVTGAGALWLALLSFFGKRYLTKLDGKADRAELVAVLESLKEQNEEARRSRSALYEKIDRHLETQTAINLGLASRVSHLEGRNHD